MDGGEVSLEGFGVDSLQSAHHKSKVFASSFLKQERSNLGEEQWRPSKFLKADNDFSVSKSTPVHHGTPVPRSEQILSFSSLKPEIAFYSKGGAGYGLLSGSRGPFTPAQWIELEHQALIYKYILANVPVPSNLLLPIRRSFDLSGSTVRSLNPNSLGWGSFHLGFSGNTDPEIGRCRRTDGKKWRCSRDAVVDQKYCEKHMNRGRHRSRKPVEGQNGHASASSVATNANMVSIASSTSASVITSGGASSVLSLGHTQFKNLPPSSTNPSADTLVNRVQDSGGLSMTSTPTTTQEVIPLEDSAQTEFGLVSSNSLMNPSQATSYMSPKGYGSLLSHSIISWPKESNTDWTQLTMSIPVANSDISSSASSPATDLLGPTWGDSVGGPLGEVLTNTSIGSPPTGARSISSSIKTHEILAVSIPSL